MKVAVAVAALAAFSGFALGRMTAVNKDLGDPPAVATTTTTTTTTDEAEAPVDPPIDRATWPAWAGGPATSSTATLSPVQAQERVQFLEGEVRRLQRLVDVQAQTQREAEGAPIAFPTGRTPQADQQQLLTSLQSALKAHGLEGDVTAVDCSEFPCIAHGSFKGIDDDAINAAFADVKEAVGGAPYASLNRFADDADPSKNKTTFSLSLYPEGLPQAEQENLNKRLRARKNAYVDSAHE